MTFVLSQVIPWGRSFDEYVRMFNLDDRNLTGRILGCADGPAAFNAEATRRGGTIVSCDPLYAHTAAEIETRITACFETVLEQARQNYDDFVWSNAIPSVEALGQVRMAAMRVFLSDLSAGKEHGRYVTAELPTLPFPDQTFELALCSHFLFLYASLGYDFHLYSVRELTRVAREVRIFPLRQLDRQPSPFVDAVVEDQQLRGYEVDMVSVRYEFQRGAREMLRVRPGTTG